MIFGVGLPTYGHGTTWKDILQVARAAEQLKYDSVWVTDHVIVPKDNVEPYGRIYEALTTLAMVAPVTEHVKLGTSVLVLPQRNPILAAKQIATIDAASGGRMIVGLGVGWNETEYRNLDSNFKDRGKRLDEAIMLLRTLWSNEDVSFRGRFNQLDHAAFAPLPQQFESRDKSIAIWIGGNGEPALERAARLGDGWHPSGPSPKVIAQGIKRIRELAPARQLTISARLSIDMNPATPPAYEYRGASRQRLSGTDDAIRAALRQYTLAGLGYAALFFPTADISVGLEQMQRFMSDIAPEFAG